MTYHLSRNGQPAGTCSKEEAIARYGRGEILPSDLVWCEGMANWTAASEVLGPLVASSAGAPVPPPPPPPPPPPVSPQVGPVAQPLSPGATATGEKPSNYLVFAILATLLCCIPTGIAAIVFAAQVDSKWSQGDGVGARDASRKARLWCLISLGVGLAANLGFLLFYGMMMAGAVHGGF